MESFIELLNDLEIRRSRKMVGLFGIFLDVWYPWLTLWIGTIPWEASSVSGGTFHWSSDSDATNILTITIRLCNIYLLLCLMTWSLSAAVVFFYSMSCDREQSSGTIDLGRCDRELAVVGVHLLIAFSGSLLQCAGLLKSGELGYLAFTLVFRIVQLACVLIYIKELIVLSRKMTMTRGVLKFITGQSDKESEDESKSKAGKKKGAEGGKKKGETSKDANNVAQAVRFL